MSRSIELVASSSQPATVLPDIARGVHRPIPRILPAGFVTPCQPSPVQAPPAGAAWLHEIKHDGFRLMVRRDGARVRLFTRNGHDWAGRFPAIAAAASALQVCSFLIDGEAVVADVRGVAFVRPAARSRARGAGGDLCARNVPQPPLNRCAGCDPPSPAQGPTNYAVGCSKEHSQQSKFRWRCAGAAALCR
jgi:hypothetical protein